MILALQWGFVADKIILCHTYIPDMMSLSPCQRAEIIDEFGDLCQEVARFKPVAARHKALREQISFWYVDAPADRPIVVSGRRYELHLSAREWQRTVKNLAKIFAVLGKAAFLRLCKISLSAVDANFTASEQKEHRLVERERTGPRDVVAIPLPTAVVAPSKGRKAA